MCIRRFVPLLLLSLSAIPLYAQTGGHGYGYFAVDLRDRCCGRLLTVGGGGDAYVYRGLAVGADLGYLFPSGNARNGVGLLSVNPSYHFTSRSRDQKVVPFVTAGYTLGFRSGTANFFNWGGGATYWFHRSLGIRAEIRDIRNSQESFHTAFRIAFAFR